jgi:methyl-accepting chemotaxis protein
MNATSGRSILADLGVRSKMAILVAVGVIVAVAVGVLSLHALAAAAAAAQRIYGGNVSSVSAVGELDMAIVQTRLDTANQLISEDLATTTRYAEQFTTDAAAVDAALVVYGASDPAGDVSLVKQVAADWRSYVDLIRTVQLPNGQRKDVTAWQNVRDSRVDPLTEKLKTNLETLKQAEAQDAAHSAGEADDDYRTSRTTTTLLLVLGSLLAVALGWLIARSVVRSLDRVRRVCQSLAEGDLTQVSGLASRDEPGQMGQALDSAMLRLRATVSTIDGSATGLAGAAEEMNGVAEQIAASAEETSMQAATVSAAAEQISRSVESVSAGSEQMGAAIREISQNASEAAQVAGDAVGLAARTSGTMNQLGESSAEIGNVIKTITAIAEQTNLLALNATIEAARAGEAGKGFAVVAAEVKDLAQETARATDDISRRVEAIQADTTGAVVAIEEITRVITRISEFQTTIASAVEEQTATTDEMNRSVSEAATGTDDVAHNITGVAEAARLTTEGVTQSQQATAELARMSAELTSLVSTFRY